MQPSCQWSSYKALEAMSRATLSKPRAAKPRVEEIEARIDRLAAQLWGLTDEELAEIQRNLEELG